MSKCKWCGIHRQQHELVKTQDALRQCVLHCNRLVRAIENHGRSQFFSGHDDACLVLNVEAALAAAQKVLGKEV